MGTTYKSDVVEWAQQQAEFLRTGQLDKLDLLNIAEEIEDVGKSEQRELVSRMAVLIAHLLKWKYQPALRGRSWELTIRGQRREIQLALKETPSLRTKFEDREWLSIVWDKALAQAISETGVEIPETGLFSTEQILSESFLPN